MMPELNYCTAREKALSLADNGSGQAYLLAADDIFWVSGWLCFALIGMVWICRRPQPSGAVHAAAD